MRSSAVLRLGEQTLLIDTGPDLHEQALREGLRKLDAVLYTHEHVDHVVGFDELRAFCWRRENPLPLYGSKDTLAALERMFQWAFSNENKYKGYVRPEARLIEGPFEVGELKIIPLPVEHGTVTVIGFRFESPGMKTIAYIPDVKRIPEPTLERMRGIEVLVIDALRSSEHPTHFSTEDALELIGELKPQQAWLTHLGHENDHAKLESSLPKGVGVAHDGLKLEL
ncbi:MAG: MBL fold metallo-hydrolase [Akkermansiaceae bacterium]|nr:MBL fold metallo-hydrolase [Akkermansiaceae bacterium]